MAGNPTKKISALAVATSSAAADSIPIVQGGVTKRIHPGSGGGLDADKLDGQEAAVLSPVGVVAPYAGISAPSGWFLCNGSAKSRTTYSALFDILTVSKGAFTVTIASPGVFTLNAHGLATGDCVELTTTGALPTGLSANTNYYVIYVNANSFRLSTSLANALAGTAINTSGSQSGTHSLRYCPWGISGASNFLVPDMREASPYGIGTRASGVTAHDSPVLGQFEDDQEQGHGHAVLGITHNRSAGSNEFTASMTTASNVTTGPSNLIGAPSDDGSHGTPRTGSVTRGKILGVNFIIKY